MFLSFSFAKWHETPFFVLQIWNVSRSKKSLCKFPLSFRVICFLKCFPPWNTPHGTSNFGLSNSSFGLLLSPFCFWHGCYRLCSSKVAEVMTWMKCQHRNLNVKPAKVLTAHKLTPFFETKQSASGPMCFSNSPWYSHQIRIIYIKWVNLQRVSPCFWCVFCWRRSPG